MASDESIYLGTDNLSNAKKSKKQITINIDSDTIDFFKTQSAESGIPYQTLINLYLTDCAKQKKNVQVSWK